MNFVRCWGLTLTIIIAVIPAHTQGLSRIEDRGSPVVADSGLTSTCDKIFSGLTRAVRPWDASLLVIGGFDLYRSQHDGGSTPFPPFGIDRQLTESLGRTDGGESPGSRLQTARFQQMILGGQFLITALLDVTKKAKVTPTDYERTFVFAKAMVYAHALTEFAKNLIARDRPDGSDQRSFFSGHASGAFVTSAFLSREISDWIDGMEFAQGSPAARTAAKASAYTIAYGWAVYVAYSRIYDRKHYLSDVLVGGIVGSAVAHILYNVHFDEADGSESTGLHLNIVPAPTPVVKVVYWF